MASFVPKLSLALLCLLSSAFSTTASPQCSPPSSHVPPGSPNQPKWYSSGQSSMHPQPSASSVSSKALISSALTASSTHSASASMTTSAIPGTTSIAQCAADMNGIPTTPTPAGYVFSAICRRYYIAAEEVLWNYVLSGWDNWLGVPIEVSPRAYSAGYTSPGSLGLKWLKALYRGYTGTTFTTLTEQPPWEGVNGPTLRAEVGDMIEILFVNKLASNYATMQSMGLAYNKDN